MTSAERRAAWCWCAFGAALLAVVAATVVPWDWLPGGRLAATDPDAGLAPATLERIDHYRDRVVPLGLAATAVSLVVALGLALTPAGARLVRALPGRRRWPLHLLVAVLALVLVGRLAVLPVSIPTEIARREAGLSTLTWPGWLLDVGRGVLVETLSTTLALVVLLAFVRWGRRGWWLLVSAAAAALVVAGSYAYPVLVEPVFNSFTPMRDGDLRTSLVELAEDDGIAVDEVLVADASRRTTALNAYVSGFGSTRRIVVYDTLLRAAPPEQVRLVVAHELGHAEADDVLTGTLLGAAGVASGVTLLLVVASHPRVRRRAGVDGLGTVEAVPLLLGLAAAASLLAVPVQGVVSRAVEARADLHALELTGDVATFEAMQRRLASANLSDPDPPAWLQVWFGTHPTTAQRIALAQGWADRERAATGQG